METDENDVGGTSSLLLSFYVCLFSLMIHKYLVGDFGCTLKFGTTVFNSSAIGCAPAGATNGRYTYMFLISVDASSGAPCS